MHPQTILFGVLASVPIVFFFNVFLDAFGAPEYVQPLQILRKVLRPIAEDFARFAGHWVAEIYVWIARQLTELWHRLGPAFHRSFEAMAKILFVWWEVIYNFWSAVHESLTQYEAVKFLLRPEVLLASSIVAVVLGIYMIAVVFGPWPRVNGFMDSASSFITAGMVISPSTPSILVAHHPNQTAEEEEEEEEVDGSEKKQEGVVERASGTRNRPHVRGRND